MALIDATDRWEKLKDDNRKVPKEIIPMITENTEARASLAKAFMEDEVVRQASRQNSLEYLKRVDEEYDRTPFWIWCLLYFNLGILFTVTVETFALNTTILDWLGLIK
jgi:hypothetical protein